MNPVVSITATGLTFLLALSPWSLAKPRRSLSIPDLGLLDTIWKLLNDLGTLIFTERENPYARRFDATTNDALSAAMVVAVLVGVVAAVGLGLRYRGWPRALPPLSKPICGPHDLSTVNRTIRRVGIAGAVCVVVGYYLFMRTSIERSVIELSWTMAIHIAVILTQFVISYTITCVHALPWPAVSQLGPLGVLFSPEFERLRRLRNIRQRF